MKLTTGIIILSCTNGDTSLTAVSATPSIARTTAGSNPVRFTNCHSPLGSATVTTFGIWSLTANDTTNAAFAAANGGAPVAQVTFHSVPSCIASVTGANISSNIWSNSSHLLNINSPALFPTTGSAGCLGTIGTFGSLSGTLSIPLASIP